LGADQLRFIAPNIYEFTEEHDLDPQQAHLWIAAHELVQAKLFAQPGMAARFRSLVGDYLGGLELNPEALPFDGLEAGFDPEKLGQMVQDPSFLTGMFTGPHQAEDLADIQAFLAVVEGYADHLLNQLDPHLMPQLPRIREAVDRRRATPSQGEVLLQKMLGIELRRPEYRTGAAFFEEIERRWGPEATVNVWETDASVPNADELTDPVAWAARALL
jgi:putative hydrolase